MKIQLINCRVLSQCRSRFDVVRRTGADTQAELVASLATTNAAIEMDETATRIVATMVARGGETGAGMALSTGAEMIAELNMAVTTTTEGRNAMA